MIRFEKYLCYRSDQTSV